MPTQDVPNKATDPTPEEPMSPKVEELQKWGERRTRNENIQDKPDLELP